jgi:hypothetical protein
MSKERSMHLSKMLKTLVPIAAFFPGIGYAALFDVTISTDVTVADFNTVTQSGSEVGAVFGVIPGDFRYSITMTVDSSSSVFYPAGTPTNSSTTPVDFYVYKQVWGTATFGTKTWDAVDILTLDYDGLDTGALWLGIPLTNGATTDFARFRMQDIDGFIVSNSGIEVQDLLAGALNDNIEFSTTNLTVSVASVSATVDLSGTIKTLEGTDICAMVLASGKYIFSCTPPGVFSLTGLPRETDGTVKRQIYADGFFPKIDSLAGSANEPVVMTRSGRCPSYNEPYDPGVFPGSAGKRINISGSVLLQNTQTPICAMVLANGQYMFSCDGTGSYALNIPLDTNGQFKLQVYADGFSPAIQIFDEFQAINDMRMARAAECQY